MALSLDSYLGVHAQALKLEAKRTELLAANLANADTPNYKARDIDFKSALAAAGTGGGSGGAGASTGVTGNAAGIGDGGASPLALVTTQGAHLGGASAAGGDLDLGTSLKYRVPMAPALDGNTVDLSTELTKIASSDNAHELVTDLYKKYLGMFKTALGRSS